MVFGHWQSTFQSAYWLGAAPATTPLALGAAPATTPLASCWASIVAVVSSLRHVVRLYPLSIILMRAT
jgi:hypothetical protein